MENMNFDNLLKGFVEERVHEATEKLISFKNYSNALKGIYDQSAEVASHIYTLSMYQMLINPEWTETDLINWFIDTLSKMNK